jgi:diguanylate cyclase (GGDEF)-like protein
MDDKAAQSSEPWSTGVNPLLLSTVYVVVWLTLDYFSAFFEIAPGVSVWYPPHAISLALLLCFGLKYWPLLFLSAFLGGSFIWMKGQPVPLALIALAITAGYTTAAWVALRVMKMACSLRLPGDTTKLLVAMLIGASIAAPLSVQVLIAFGITELGFMKLTTSFWLGDLVGTLLLTPVLLVLLQQPPDLVVIKKRLPEMAALVITALVAVILTMNLLQILNMSAYLLIFPPLFWACFRFGTQGAIYLIALTGIVTMLTVKYSGINVESLDLQIFLCTAAVTGLLMGAEVNRRESLQQHLRHRAEYDELTGLKTRAYFFDALNNASARHQRQHQSTQATLLLVDINDFKSINDALGHDAGDIIIRQVASRLAETLGETATLARLGGDEFAALITDRSPGETLLMCQRILDAMKVPVPLDTFQKKVSVAIGASQLEKNGCDAREVLLHADLALYEAKKNRQGGYAFFSKDLDDQFIEKQNIKKGIEAGMANDNFYIELQPIININTGHCIKAECLLRTREPNLEGIPIDKIIMTAEEFSLIQPLGRHVIEKATTIIKEKKLSIPLTINISVLQLTDDNFSSYLSSLLQQKNITPESLQLEITENVFLRLDDAVIEEQITKIRDLGVQLLIDDFGVEYSSLSYFLTGIFQSVKIDRIFIKNLGDSKQSQSIIRAIIFIADSFGMDVIAEGVETKEQLGILKALGCRYVQGFLFSKSISPVALENFINAKMS